MEENENKVIYFKDKKNGEWKELGKIASIDIVPELCDEKSVVKIDSIDNKGERKVEFIVNSENSNQILTQILKSKLYYKYIPNEKYKKLSEKRLKKKRFKKLLMSLGIQRNGADIIVKIENITKGYYSNYDIEKYKRYIEEMKKILLKEEK